MPLEIYRLQVLNVVPIDSTGFVGYTERIGGQMK